MTSEFKDIAYRFLLTENTMEWEKREVAFRCNILSDQKREFYSAIDELVQEGLVIAIEVTLSGYCMYRAATPHEITQHKSKS